MPEPHKSILDRKNTPLRDGRTPDIASTVLQKVLLSLKGSHMGYPPASLLKLKQTFKLIAIYFKFKLARFRRPSKSCNYQPLPTAHQFISMEEDPRMPT
jgi:hypothetical protein